MFGVPVFKLCSIEQIQFLSDKDKDITEKRFNQFAENHTDELPSGDFDFEIYDIIFNHLSEELSCDFHALINRCGLGNLRNPNEGLWDFIVFDRDMAAKIIPILKNSDQFSLHGKIVGLPEYFATDYDLQDKKEAFSNAIDILLRHMRLVEKDSVLVFLLY